MPLSVVERSYEHGVSLVNITKSVFRLQPLKLSRFVPFLRVPEKGRLKIEEVEEALKALRLDFNAPQQDWPFVQIALQIDGPQPGFRGRLDELCSSFPLRDVAPDIEWPGQKADKQQKKKRVRRLGEHSPEELFKDAFARHYGTKPKERHLRCFRQLLEEVGT
jgi:exonuclease SbcD